MSYHPRIESKDHTSFTTSRCRNSELWFVNNKQLEARILAYLAKYTTMYEVILYGFAIEGNHIQGELKFERSKNCESCGNSLRILYYWNKTQGKHYPPALNL
jgi:hypothetical protein